MQTLDFNLDTFEKLCNTVHNCLKCTRMDNSTKVLNQASGSLNADIMFIGEAPGRLGADETGIPFHGDATGNNFEALLKFSNISRHDIFVTNSVLCNPKDETGNNSTPTKDEISNCSNFLKEQINIIQPHVIVTLGGTALFATNLIEKHLLTLKNVRTANVWYNRLLIPLYHPGQRAMVHRNIANQRSDYQFVYETFKRLNIKKQNTVNVKYLSNDIIAILNVIITQIDTISYFALHKIFYLIELEYFKQYHQRLTNAYIVRQKDGPYCTDLHYKKLKKSLPNISFKDTGEGLILRKVDNNLLEFEANDLPKEVIELIIDVINKYGSKSNSALKTQVYLTKPMRNILEIENKQFHNLYNTPITFEFHN